MICRDSYLYDNYLYAYIFDGSYNNSKIEKYLIQNDKVQLVDSRIVPPDKYTQSEWNNGETRIVFKIALSEPYTVYGKRGESHKLYDYCISIEDNSTISSFTLSGLNKDVDYYDENISRYLLHYKVTIYEKNNIIYFGFDITDKQYMIITYDLTQMSMKYNTYVTGGTTKLINANDKLYIPATSGLIQLTD